MPKAPVDGSIPWRLMWWFAWLVRPFLCKLHVDGIDNVPLSGGFLLASNHFAGLDTVVKGFTCPRQIHYMAKKEIFEVNAFTAWFFPTFGVFPIDRGRLDLHALQEAVSLVRSGPCGRHLSRRERAAETGHWAAGRPAPHASPWTQGCRWCRSCRWAASTYFQAFSSGDVRRSPSEFGKPLHLQGDVNKSADARRETSRIMYAIAELLPPERRGVYADIPVNDLQDVSSELS